MAPSSTFFLALRYLRPKRSFVSVITLISIVGVAVGVLMMVVVRSVMQGFEADFRNTLLGTEPHVTLSHEEKAVDDAGGAKWQDLEASLRKLPEALSTAPFAGGVIYLEHAGAQTGLQIFGLPRQEAGPYLAKVGRHLVAGSLDLADGTLVVSDFTASDLGVRVGDKVSVYPSKNVTDVVHRFRAIMDERDAEKKREAYRQIKLHPTKLKIAGIIRGETGGYYGYTSLKTGQQVFGLGEGVTGIALELRNPDDVDAFVSGLEAAGTIPRNWKTIKWTDAGDARLKAMENEQTMMQFVLSIIALVAAFSVMNTTITVTTQKRREIGVLTALGSRQGQIVGVFVLQAAVVGVLGTFTGLAGSFLVLWLRNDIRTWLAMASGGEVHDIQGVFLASIPAQVQTADVVFTCTVSILLCLAAALPPAWFAARVDPAVALRD